LTDSHRKLFTRWRNCCRKSADLARRQPPAASRWALGREGDFRGR
jgi:hypothetical protein